MAANQREFTVTVTTLWTLVPEVNPNTSYNHIVVQNYTDGNVDVAFGVTTVPDFTVLANTDRALSPFNMKGAMYVRNSTGTGGTAIVTIWH